MIGETILDVEIIWEKSWSTNLLSTKPFEIIFPHTYFLRTTNDVCAILAASIFEEGDIKPFVEGLWITTNLQLARERKLIND